MQIDGQSVALLPGSATAVTVSMLASGPFQACVTGTTLCGTPIPPACCAADAPVTFLRGDASANSALDIGDVTGTLAVIFQGSPHLCFDALDSNDDGAVDITDPILTLWYLFANGPPPAGSGGCEADVTSDGIDCASHLGCP